ncbi:hypothetical protein DVS28_b0356 (plasmid) [Euzebya pacifica]|uniref:Uncharacterized protein n=1 Tax=Euzebya pacifica TaxID=1608957 RepID=A0A346Y6M9_9ACTN|nr:hypothetical protein [Euzebya pacifica]AXV10126.1 hypothetical protein DVS28_b0356 [Euzebya pacifica]
MATDGRWFTVGTTDRTVIVDTVNAVRSADVATRNPVLIHLAEDGRFDQFLVACRTQTGAPRLWATLVLHIRAMRAQPAVYSTDAIPAERVIAAADGLQRAVAGEVDLAPAGRGLAAMLAAVIPVLRGSGAPDPLLAALEADLATVTEDLGWLGRDGVGSIANTG